MDEERLPFDKPPRRAFIASAAITFSSFVASTLGGCAREDIAPNAADDAELDSLRKVDARYIAYRETAKIDTGMEEPRGIALDAHGVLYVVGDRALLTFGMDGARRAAMALEGEPTCLSVAPDGALYIGLTDHVEVYRSDGQRAAVWPALEAPAHITAIAVGEKDIWIANAAGRIVLRCDRTGRIVGRLCEKNAAAGYPGLIVPSPHLDAAPAPGGMVYVSNPGMHRVETHTPDGVFKSAWGTSANTLDAFCGCCNPTDFALLPDGRFVTAEKGIPRVKVYSATGQFVEVVAGPDSFASNTMGLDLATTKDGRVLVLDPKARAVRIFTRTGGSNA